MRQHRVWAAALLLGAAALLLAPATASAQLIMNRGIRPVFGGYYPYGWGYSPWAAGYPYYGGSYGYGDPWAGYPTYVAPSYNPGNTTFTPSAMAQSATHSVTTSSYPTEGTSPYADNTTFTQAGNASASTHPGTTTPAPATTGTEGSNTAQLNVRVPDANAQVWIEGQLTKQTGTRREFASPPLNPGRTYNYEVRARWTENGRTTDQTRTVAVRANDAVTVDFAAAGGNSSRVEEIGSQPAPAGPNVTTRVNNNSRIDDFASPAKPAKPARPPAKPSGDSGNPPRP
jgi:uncharacterized protein (TIGR03000 family)